MRDADETLLGPPSIAGSTRNSNVSNKPETHNGDLANLPKALEPLTEQLRWVNWNWEPRTDRDGNVKWTKPPYQPRDPRRKAESDNPTTWDTYDRAVQRVRAGDADGIGYVLLGSDIGAVDLDDCCRRDAKARKTKIDPWARELRDEANGAYCEVTVSGTGLRLIGKANGPNLHRSFEVDRKTGARIELFRDAARYITISGLKLGKCAELPPIDVFLDALRARYESKSGPSNGQDRRKGSEIDYDDLIRNGAPQGERSELFHSVVWHLAAKGLSAEKITDELNRHPNGIAAKYADRLHAEVIRSFHKWERQNPTRRRGRRIIRVVDGQIARLVDEAQDALIAAQVPIFVRGGKLVEPVTDKRPAADERKVLVTIFSPLSEAKVGYLLNKHAAVFKRFDARSKQEVEIDPPKKVAVGLIALRGWKFPRVAGIIAAPTLRPDGSILCEPGYDEETQLWNDADVVLPDIPERPTRAQAKAALKWLKGLLAGFAFVSDLDRAVALSALLTAVLRGALENAPLHFVRAHTAGEGKSYLIDLVAMIATGRKCPVITGTRSAEEMEKRLGAILLEGSALISIDNLSHDLEGDLLCQMLTQNLIKPRILGKSETPECEWRGALLATGNNVRPVGDLVRRTLVANLDSKVERPELREFKFNPSKRVKKNRGAYIAAALVIARAYLAAGAPKGGQPLASYDEWSEFVREPLIWLGEGDPARSIEQAREEDPERAAAAELILRWRQRIGVNKPIRTAGIIAIAKQTKDGGNTPRWPRFHALLVEHAANTRGEIDAVRLGKWLRKILGRVFDGYHIEVVAQGREGNQWNLFRASAGVRG